MIRNLPSHITRLILYISLQVLVFKQVALFDRGFNFIYVVGLLLLPMEIGHLTMIAVGFVVGITVDLFYNTQGIHAAACVLITFIRPYYFRRTTGGSYEVGSPLTVRSMGLTWFFIFLLPMILVHHLTIFYAEAGSGNLFFFTLSKVFVSSLFTFTVAIIIQYLFTKPSRRL